MLINSKNFLRKLPLKLPTTKRFKQLLDSVSAPATGFGRSEWVLSRPLYRFTRFDLKSVPRPQRAQAVSLQIRQWAPFARTGWYLSWDKDHALVWAWDAERVESAIASNTLKPKSTPVIPETVLHQRQGSGACLVACMEGYEGQVWLDDSLIASRWWPGLPGASEWINFQRDAASMPENQSEFVPAPLPAYWAEKPWGKAAPLDRTAVYGGKAEAWIVPLLALCLFSATIWYGAQWIKIQAAIAERSAELAAISRRAEPIIQARAQALDALIRVNQLQAVDPYPDQLSLMSRVAESLPKDGTYLKEWEFLNGKLKLVLASPGKLASSEYIKLFQSMEIFRNVQAVPASDPANLALSMETLPQTEIKTK
jgi:hypothetical protein